jgi:hypothetical protein
MGKNAREFIKKGFEVLLLLMRLDNARTDNHFGAEPAGCKHPFRRHLPMKLEGRLEMLVVKERGNAAIVQVEARGGIHKL